jgi:hypothetical protein
MPHFRQRWHDTIGPDSDAKIKSRLKSALVNKTIWGTRGAFAVEIDGCKAVCVIEPTLQWAFITLLRPGMELKDGEVG